MDKRKEVAVVSLVLMIILLSSLGMGVTAGSGGSVASEVPPTSIVPPGSILGSSSYQCSPRCQQIDEVWASSQLGQSISKYIFTTPDMLGKIWVNGVWKLFSEVYSFAVTSPLGRFTDFNFGSVQFTDTTHLPALIAEAQSQGMNPCFPLVTVLMESQGNPNAIGNDANVVGCEVLARRLLLMGQSENCKGEYENEEALKVGCMKDSVLDSGGFHIPNPTTACLSDFVNLTGYFLRTPTKSEFCVNNFPQNSLWGIGLGQITIPQNQGSIVIDGIRYNHCDLFDPAKNIKATVGKLKELGTATATTKERIIGILGSYVGASEHGAKRYPYFEQCQRKQQTATS